MNRRFVERSQVWCGMSLQTARRNASLCGTALLPAALLPAALLSVALLSVALCNASVARADDAAQARYHDDLARGHYADGRFELAIREFFLEQRIAPNPRIVFNIALCFEELGRVDDAFVFFSDYLASDDADAERRQLATAALARVSPRVAQVYVTSEPPGAPIYVDRAELGSFGTTPRTIALPPGAHSVWVEPVGFSRAGTQLTARVGARVEATLRATRVVAPLVVEGPANGRAEVKDADARVVASGALPLRVELPPSSYEVRVDCRGFETWTGLARVRERTTTQVTATPVALPMVTGELTVTSNVPGAIIEVDGRPAGFAPSVLDGLRPGPHRLRVRQEGLVEWSGPVEVRADQRTWLTVTLEEPAQRERSPWTYVVGGLGAASTVTAVVLAVLASSAHSDFEAQRGNAPADALDARDRGLSLATAADVLGITGLVSLGASVLLWFLTEHEVSRPSRASASTPDDDEGAQ